MAEAKRKQYKNHNTGSLSGHVANDPYVNEAGTFAAFDLRVNVEEYENGENSVVSHFFPCVVFGNMAKWVRPLKGGSAITVDGYNRIHKEEYEKDGNTVKVNKWQLVVTEGSYQSGGGGGDTKTGADAELPTSTPKPAADEEDIPF